LAAPRRSDAVDDAQSDKERLDKAITVNDSLVRQITEMEELIGGYKLR